ncbi:MAG: UDP-glucose 6-dehydrogenase [Coxiellaceae bacterium]|nr:UDP-glucose 6-dehydrogenase [Coxiellaceae bacterium]
MKLVIMGAGYVGLTAAVCFAEMGNDVVCIEVNPKKLALLQEGQLPIFEPYLETLFQHNVSESRLNFAASLDDVDATIDAYFICVGTPALPTGECNLSHVISAAESIAGHVQQPSVVVTKSTVPVGTGDRIELAIQSRLPDTLKDQVTVVSNPEFMKEGVAIDDFMSPDRILLGLNDDRALSLLQQLYAPFTRKSDRIITMSRRDAEMSKYVANAMLANRISFMNEMALICDQWGADIEHVRKGIGSDRRIGEHFLYAGCGFGGSCFPKDVSALKVMAQQQALDPLMLQAIETRNAQQKLYLFDKLQRHYSSSLAGRHLAVWGLSFKPETDDVRDSTAMVMIEKAIRSGMTVSAYDPVATDAFKAVVPSSWIRQGQLRLCDEQYQALESADALALLTEWKQFRQPDFERIHTLLKHPVILDGRNQYDAQTLQTNGFVYFGIGRGADSIRASEPSSSLV